MKDAPHNCADCNRPMRGSKHTLEARPGTVKHEGRGLCTSCYRRHAVDGTLPEPIRHQRTAADRTNNLTPCQGKDCQRMLRPLGARLEDYPGSFGVKAKGLCSACYDPSLTEERATPEGIARTARELASYAVWRRPFRAKAGALL